MPYGRRDVWYAAFAAFVAWGLLVQRLPVLRFVGYAFNLGLFTALALVAAVILLVSRSPSPRLAGKHGRGPALTSPSLWKSEKNRYGKAQEYKSVQLYPESFVVSQALDGVINLALRDFVTSWYTNISRSPSFVNELDKNIREALVNVRDRLQREDIPSFVIARIVPVIKNHLRDFDQAERLVRGKSLNRSITESEELDLAIAGKYRDGNLHPAASLSYSDTKGILQEHIRKAMVRVLPQILPDQVISSRAVSVLIKEIVSCAVLSPILQMLADPDTWNQIIEAYGRRTLQDRKTVKRMRAALDQHTSPIAQGAPAELPRLSPNDSERSFERFVRAIRKTKTLADARRFRSQLKGQLAKESMVEGQDAVYIRRLEMGKRVLEQKIARLESGDKTAVPQVAQQDVRSGRVPKVRDLPLTEIMHTASGLSYFMEFMDRRQKMSLVQFWIVVDGFRSPLEDDFGDDTAAGTTTTWTDTDRMDIAQISETYISKSELKVPEESQEAIRVFLVTGRKATPEQYRAARTAILTAQSAVLEELETNHFSQFKKSDLYYKFLASDEASANGVDAQKEVESSAVAALNRSMQPSPMIRSSSQPATRVKNLRRAALSSTDVKNLASVKLTDANDIQRRSYDNGDRLPLFDDGYDTDPLAHSTASIGSDSVNGDIVARKDVIENMEAALTDIIASPTKDLFGDDQDGLFGSNGLMHESPRTPESPRSSIDASRIENALMERPRPSVKGTLSDKTRPSIQTALSEKSRPSIATLGLVNTSSRIGVFTDNDLFPDEEKFAEDEYADPDAEPDEDPNADIHEAAPGDLGLTEAIKVLSADIERLVSQESVVDTLTRKAELTNNVAELRILGKSKASLQREIRRKELQRQQYIVQESDNSLYGRSSIRITSVMVGREEDGREYAMYVIEVQRQAGDQMPSAIWAVTRRYSEFHDLHQRLRRRYPSTRNLEFPRRRMVMKLQKQFLHNRQLALEAYLQQLLRMPEVCRSRDLRSFLSQSPLISENQMNSPSDTQDIVTRIYNSVTDGMDEFLGNIAVLDQLSSAGQNLISAATGQPAIPARQAAALSGAAVGPGSIAEAEAELRAFEDRELEPFVKPICDIFLEVFELNRGNNWLRGRAVVVVLHQLLGGTVERKIRDGFRALLAEDVLLGYVDLARDNMWPGGVMKPPGKPRTVAEKTKSRNEAGVVLATLVPDLVGSVVGRANAQAAARRIMATMNNRRLNEHLVGCIFDEIVGLLFDVPVARRAGVG